MKARCAKVGVTGFCMGGALTLLAAVSVPEADAGVVWYGFPPLEYIDASKIKMPLLGHYATLDVPFPIATVDKLEDKLRAAKVNFEFHCYESMHAFANETAVAANRLPITEYQRRGRGAGVGPHGGVLRQASALISGARRGLRA